MEVANNSDSFHDLTSIYIFIYCLSSIKIIMDYYFQNILIGLIFIYAIWNLIQYFRNTLKSDGCSSLCSSCNTGSSKVAKLKVKQL